MIGNTTENALAEALQYEVEQKIRNKSIEISEPREDGSPYSYTIGIGSYPGGEGKTILLSLVESAKTIAVSEVTFADPEALTTTETIAESVKALIAALGDNPELKDRFHFHIYMETISDSQMAMPHSPTEGKNYIIAVGSDQSGYLEGVPDKLLGLLLAVSCVVDDCF